MGLTGKPPAVVSPGSYDIIVSKTGFKVAKFAAQHVSVGNVMTLNVTLEVGSLAETVAVTAAAVGRRTTAKTPARLGEAIFSGNNLCRRKPGKQFQSNQLRFRQAIRPCGHTHCKAP